MTAKMTSKQELNDHLNPSGIKIPAFNMAYVTMLRLMLSSFSLVPIP